MFWICPDGFQTGYSLNKVQKEAMPMEKYEPYFEMASAGYKGHPDYKLSPEDLMNKNIWVCDTNDEVILPTRTIADSSFEKRITSHPMLTVLPRLFVINQDLELVLEQKSELKVLDTTSQKVWNLQITCEQLVIADQLRRKIIDGEYENFHDAGSFHDPYGKLEPMKNKWYRCRINKATQDSDWAFSDDSTAAQMLIERLTTQWQSVGTAYPEWNVRYLKNRVRRRSVGLHPAFLIQPTDFSFYTQILNWSQPDSETLLEGGRL